MSGEIIFLMLDAVIILLIVSIALCVVVMQKCKEINDNLNERITRSETRHFSEKFKVKSKAEERKLDGQDYSFDVSDDPSDL